MKRNTKKGFTIVELIIVIAVIAVLAAVLIPTFSNLIQKANVAADTTLIKNLNTALAMDTSVSKHVTMTQALEATKENGFDVEKIVARATNNKIVWDSVNDCFAYSEKDKNALTYIPDSKTDANVEAYQLWTIVKDTTLDQQYSSYIAGTNVTGPITATKGVDVGENKGITSINYKNDSGKSQSVVIRTNNGETELEISAKNDTVKHYGTVGNVNVIAVDKNNSYHEFGSARTLTVTSGHIVLESGSLVYELKKAQESSNVSFANFGTVIKTEGITGVTTAKTYDIDTLDKLCAFRDYVNAGMEFSDLPVEIKADIDMSSVSWKPIGTAENPFNGEIRGNGHTLKGLTNGNVELADNYFTTTTTKTYGAVYGFIAIAGAKTAEKSLKVSNINFSAVNIDTKVGNCVGTLIGYAPSTANFKEKFSNEKFSNENKALQNIVITNVNVDASSRVTVLQDAGGICGKLYNEGKVEINNCVNKGNITALKSDGNGRAAGIVSYVSLSGTDSQIIIDGCKNEGTIQSYQYLAGIACYGFVDKDNSDRKTSVTVRNCSNSGELIWQGSAEDGCRAGYIVTLGGTAFSNATQGCSYNFATKNTNTGKLTTPNYNGAGAKVLECWAEYVKYEYQECNGKSATKN